MQLHEYITGNDLTPDNERRVYNVIHLMGSHFAYGGGVFNLDLNFATLNAYFEKMKEIGVYDNSTIIILGDHGDNDQFAPDVFSPTSTSVLIKPRGAAGELKTDNEAELSHKYFPASILELAGISHDTYGLSYFDIIGGAPAPPVRIIYALSDWWASYEAEGWSGAMASVGLFEVTGDSLDPDNWFFIEATR